ncbi:MULTISPECIES: hypothetical protein, partial [unclassified Microcoleus]
IEDTRQSPIELGETEDTVPTYHWSEIVNPRYKDVFDLLSNSVIVTQKVNPNGTTAKTVPPTPACVIYDEAFIQYQLLEVIAPFICSAENANFEKEAPTLDKAAKVYDRLKTLFQQTFEDSIKRHDNAIHLCEDMGVTLQYEPKSMLRSFKLSIAQNQKNENFLDSLSD